MRCGEVHDENAAALGGVAAHAGLFGTAAAVGACARWWMRSPSLPLFAARTAVPNSSRALGWDTMLPTSSCGTKMSASAIGHTGFTGTSLWIDPAHDLYVVILTNRVHPTREGDGIQDVRRALHDAIVTGLQADAGHCAVTSAPETAESAAGSAGRNLGRGTSTPRSPFGGCSPGPPGMSRLHAEGRRLLTAALAGPVGTPRFGRLPRPLRRLKKDKGPLVVVSRPL